ncbi:hypothetical protein FNV43_RR09757 [Rhamnella rubrinervis]|uniref:Uncharacterized protein n=1 Tax=Rhamnella rubrinervis TaxID=2594499 RepID=A0A8K0MKH9_9ROSA|nr:hypothetical protein FNV43_RR09757 [Rhamnella rubrinervis]
MDVDGWRGKTFPFFDRLTNIFGKDRVTSRGAETPVEMEDEVNREEVNLNDIGVETMYDIDVDETSPVTVQNR